MSISRRQAHTVAPHAIIGLANYHQATPNRVFGSACVQSRMLLWCRSGAGRVRVNQAWYELAAGAFLILPWAHAIQYHPDPHAPYGLGGVHIIPRFKPGRRFLFGVVHRPEDRLADSRFRHDVKLPGLDHAVAGNFALAPALEHLADYIVHWYQQGRRDEPTARQLAQVLVQDLIDIAAGPSSARSRAPASLRHMLAYVNHNLDKPISIDALARAGDCSAATVSRLFRRHLDTTPIHWIQQRKMDRAAEFLATTSLRVGEVGERVGIADPFYFSKLFRRVRGITAREHRRRASLV